MHKCIHIFFRFFSPHTEDPKKYRETRIREENKNAARGGGKAKVKSLSCVQLFGAPWTAADQGPPSMGFSRQEYWSGLPFPSPRDLPDPGIEPESPSLQADTLPSEPLGNTGYP